MCYSILAFSGRRATIVLIFVLVTERSKHASDIAKNLPLDVGYDALVLLSGDGLIHEVFNGFAEHDDPIRAFAMPIVPIPTGSGNGTALNLLGLAVCRSFIIQATHAHRANFI